LVGGVEAGLSVLFVGSGGRDVGDVVMGGLQASRSAAVGPGSAGGGGECPESSERGGEDIDPGAVGLEPEHARPAGVHGPSGDVGELVAEHLAGFSETSGVGLH